MNQTDRGRGHTAELCSLGSSPDCDDDIDYKEFCFPADPTGELAMRCGLKSAFECAGFRVTRVEKPSPYHPVWLIRIGCQLERHFVSASAFHDQIRGILDGAGIHLRKRDLTAQRSGNRAIVTFVWEPGGRSLQRS